MDGDAPHYSFCINDLPVMSKNESILFNLSCSLLRTHYDRTNNSRLWKTSRVQVQDSGQLFVQNCTMDLFNAKSVAEVTAGFFQFPVKYYLK